jgi:hypothetical protein
VAFFCRGGTVALDLADAEGALSVDWVEVRTGERTAAEPLQGGGVVHLAAPGEAPWVAVIRKA